MVYAPGPAARRSRGKKLQWGHDDGVVGMVLIDANPRHDRHVCFNGATTMVSWNGGPSSSTPAQSFPTTSKELQWGHDDGVVEWIDGGPETAGRATLQWGHDDGFVEWTARSSGGKHAGAGEEAFNGGHDDGVVEWVTTEQPATPETLLQWGHDDGVVEWAIRKRM